MVIPNYEKLGEDKVVLSLSDFEDMLDVIAYDEAKAIYAEDTASGKESVPAELVERLLNGDNPLRVWREYRNLTQAELGKKSGVSQTTVAEIESGRKKGSIDTLKSIAFALNVDLDDLV